VPRSTAALIDGGRWKANGRLTHYRSAMPFGNRKMDFSVQNGHSLKKYHSSKNLKFNNLGIFQSLKLLILMEKTFQFPLT